MQIEKFKDTFRALRNRNYRLFYAGQGISLIGTWLQRTTMGWFIYRLTGSVFLLGLIGFVSSIPSLFVNPFAGAIADKYNRHRIIIITQFMFMIQATTLAILVLTNTVQVWHVICLNLFLGLTEGLDSPIRQSFVVDMIEDKRDISNAIALNSALFNSARLIGPSVAGVLIVYFSEGLCFLINGLSYIAVISSLLVMKIKPREVIVQSEPVLSRLKEGYKYAFQSVPIRYFISSIAVFSLFGMSYTTLLPVVAKDILHGDSRTMGFMMSTAGIGALLGAFHLASRKSMKGMGNKVVFGGISVSIGLTVLALSRYFPLSLGVMLFLGLGFMMQMATTNTMLQNIVEDDKRGRVMSMYIMAGQGIAPIGSLLVGTISSRIGVTTTIICSGVICFMWAIFMAIKMPMIRKSIRSTMEIRHQREAIEASQTVT